MTIQQLSDYIYINFDNAHCDSCRYDDEIIDDNICLMCSNGGGHDSMWSLKKSICNSLANQIYESVKNNKDCKLN